MIQATITEIGTEAINKEEPMLILFDKTATAALRKYSVIQEVSKDEPFSLKAGGTITFDDQSCNRCLNHRTLSFTCFQKQYNTFSFFSRGE